MQLASLTKRTAFGCVETPKVSASLHLPNVLTSHSLKLANIALACLSWSKARSAKYAETLPSFEHWRKKKPEGAAGTKMHDWVPSATA